MASDINQTVLVGRLTRDMELKYTSGGMAIGHIGIAVNRRVKKGDQWVDEANFFEGTLFGKQAEGLNPYLLKGQQIALVGELRQERWEKDGQKFSKVTIAIGTVELLGGKKEGDQGSKAGSDEKPQGKTEEYSPPRGFDDDIPF